MQPDNGNGREKKKKLVWWLCSWVVAPLLFFFFSLGCVNSFTTSGLACHHVRYSFFLSQYYYCLYGLWSPLLLLLALAEIVSLSLYWGGERLFFDHTGHVVMVGSLSPCLLAKVLLTKLLCIGRGDEKATGTNSLNVILIMYFAK